MNKNPIAANGECRLDMVAGDLTGTCNAGVQFVTRGFSTVMWLHPELMKDILAELTVITTNSGDEARRKIRRACRRFG